MFGLKERPYTGRVLKRFWCDSDNKNFNFFTIHNFSIILYYMYYSFANFGHQQNLVM